MKPDNLFFFFKSTGLLPRRVRLPIPLLSFRWERTEATYPPAGLVRWKRKIRSGK